MINFCHITTTPHRDLVRGRNVHLVLAHLLERDQDYIQFYRNEAELGSTLIMDNSGFEMYKQGRPMFDPSKLVELASLIHAEYIVLPDHPGKNGQYNIDAAKEFIDEFRDAGFKTFFVPQSEIGHMEDYLSNIEWALCNTNIDLIGMSILGAPNAFGNIERDNKLQRFLARWRIMKVLESRGLLTDDDRDRFHFLGMLDGPLEIEIMKDFHDYIFSWDSSAAIWAGLNGITFDQSPTGLIDGKFEKEVNFDFKTDSEYNINLARLNMQYIDELCE